MGIEYVCNFCDPPYGCKDREELRIMPSGDWICAECYEDAPMWTFSPKPPDQDDPQYPRWDSFPEVPEYVPKTNTVTKYCHVCGDVTKLACSDCAISFGATVNVCSKSTCRDAHENSAIHVEATHSE